jgi:hypothetical protein
MLISLPKCHTERASPWLCKIAEKAVMTSAPVPPRLYRTRSRNLARVGQSGKLWLPGRRCFDFRWQRDWAAQGTVLRPETTRRFDSGILHGSMSWHAAGRDGADDVRMRH